MIKIEHPNLDSIVQTHYQACYNYVLLRLNFYIDFVDALGNKNLIKFSGDETVVKKYNLKDKTIFSLINPFLIKEKKYRNKHFNVGINEVKSVLTTRDTHIIKEASKNYGFYKDMYTFFVKVKQNIDVLLVGKPDELAIFAKTKIAGTTKECIEKVFSYETLIGTGFQLPNGKYWNNYSLTESLGISVCPYCNRNWVNTVTDGKYIKKDGKKRSKLTSPQLDHFFSKSDVPLLRLSFYNLIPSCETCNARLKKKIEFEYDKHLHPYEEGYGSDCCFEASPVDYNSAIGIGTKYNINLNLGKCTDTKKISKVNESHKVFEIDTIYKEHGDIVSELFRKKEISNDKYVELLQKQFPSAKLTKQEIYRLAFGNYYEEVDFKRRPFAKLTKDVAEQLGIIK